MAMTLEQAIKTAREFENKVRNTYLEAEQQAKDPVGRKVFGQLAKEEQSHVAYLDIRLREWLKSGHVKVERLTTVVPDSVRIKEGVSRLTKELKGKGADHTAEVALLRRALLMEQETSAFYRRMVSELGDEGQKLFARFVEIEEGHVAIVQAEIDSVTGLGFWFDMQEFRLEAE
jgi:rubrerythrin